MNLSKNTLNQSHVLLGKEVELHPLRQTHFDQLIEAAKDPRIWEYYIFDANNPDKFKTSLNQALINKENLSQYPFVIFHKKSRKIIGSTRLMDIQFEHNKLEIGWTWIVPEYWGTNINFECKLLLLELCFEKFGCARVQFKTDENNIRSRKAIEKIGAKFEGVLRNDMLRENGTYRNSAYFSIIQSEWQVVKESLNRKLA